MTPLEYQQWCRRFDNHNPYLLTATLALGLCAEAGEVANLVERSRREPISPFGPDEDELALELGDVLWNVARLADEAGFTLEELMERNINKLIARYEQAGIPLR